MAVLTAAPEAIEQFHEQGFLIMRDFFEPEIVAEARAESAALAVALIESWSREGKLKRTFPDDPFETRLSRVVADAPGVKLPTVFRTELHRPGFFRLFFNRFLLDIIGGLLGPEIRLYPNYSVRPKLPDHEGTVVLWHQDAGYTASGKHGRDESAKGTSVDQLRMVNVWTPLVPATVENGCMQFVPGTHKLGVVPHVWGNETYLEIEPEWLNPRLGDAIDVEMEPGDVVMFSNLLFHRGLPNRSQGIRWSADWRYQDADQSTMRDAVGHLARSDQHPAAVVQSAEQWAKLSFG